MKTAIAWATFSRGRKSKVRGSRVTRDGGHQGGFKLEFSGAGDKGQAQLEISNPRPNSKTRFEWASRSFRCYSETWLLCTNQDRPKNSRKLLRWKKIQQTKQFKQRIESSLESNDNDEQDDQHHQSGPNRDSEHVWSTNSVEVTGVLDTPEDGLTLGIVPTPEVTESIGLDQIQSPRTTTEVRNPICTINKIVDTIPSLFAIRARQGVGKGKGKGDESIVEPPKKSTCQKKLLGKIRKWTT